MAAPLPIDPFLPSIVEGVRQHRAAVVVASPGAGKTTRVPPALAADGPVILLQPRRIAARSIARRISVERGWTLGREVGWQVRFERTFSEETKLLVATEGILTARLQQDPLLSAFLTVVLDEFHERTIHADLGIALARQAWRARDDLRLVIMSATIDAGRVAAFLDDAPVFEVPGTLHPMRVEYRPRMPVGEAAREVLAATTGQVLCFLPGARETAAAAAEIRAATGVESVELHGSLTAEEQERALAPVPHRRIIAATNIAETSLTVPGVSAVVDSGLHKIPRYDADRGVDSLELERIPQASAEQRAGRAGRLGPGVVLRLWDERDRLRPYGEPEILRIDLSGPALDVFAWGGDPRTFEWFERPAPGALDAALRLLGMLGAIEHDRLTALGREMSRLVLHPRLARILIDARGAQDAAIACAILSERHRMPRHPPTTGCDLLASPGELDQRILQSARDLQRGFSDAGRLRLDEAALRRALLAGYPDRVAQRRRGARERVLLATGHGGVMGDESGVRTGELLLALDLQSGRPGAGSEARVRIASVVDREWLKPTDIVYVDDVDDETGELRSFEREMYGAIVLRERPLTVDPAAAERHLADLFLARPLSEADTQLVNRLRFAGFEVDLREIARRAASGRRRLDEVRLENGVDSHLRRRLDAAAPPSFTAPSGRTHPLTYGSGGTVSLSIKLQELFGLAETPLVGTRREPLLIHLLAPNGRPVQTTRDLRSFWNTTYADVRRELRGRYPKHPWPDDPWTATATARTRPRSKNQ